MHSVETRFVHLKSDKLGLLVPAVCTFKSAQPVPGGGFGSTALMAKKSNWHWASHPNVSLKVARLARDAAKLQKSEGRDPVQARKVEKLKAIPAIHGHP